MLRGLQPKKQLFKQMYQHYTNDINLFNTNTAYSNTFASIISDNTTQDLFITQNSITINSLLATDLQKLDKLDLSNQSVSGPVTFHDSITMITGNTLFCNNYRAPSNGLHIQFVMFNREFNINRDGRMWMSS